jgi:hypothetical protein
LKGEISSPHFGVTNMNTNDFTDSGVINVFPHALGFDIRAVDSDGVEIRARQMPWSKTERTKVGGSFFQLVDSTPTTLSAKWGRLNLVLVLRRKESTGTEWFFSPLRSRTLEEASKPASISGLSAHQALQGLSGADSKVDQDMDPNDEW